MAATLARGQSGPLVIDEVVVSVRFTASADLSALLLTDSGTVRNDTDLVFYNQQTTPGVWLTPSTSGAGDSVAITLSRIPFEITQILVLLSLDDQRGKLGNYPPPQLMVSDIFGNTLYEYVIEGLGTESTAIAIDFNRAGRQWKVHAAGEGYPGGFSALISDHGVLVDSSATAPMPEVELSPTHSADVLKGQDVSLVTGGGQPLGYLKMALGWDAVRVRSRFGLRDAEIDLDASALVYMGKELVDYVTYDKLLSSDGAMRHSGDDLSGATKGDNEIISVDLNRMPEHVTTIVFVVTSYAKHTFERVQNAFWRLVDGTTGVELARYDLLGGGPYTGMVMAKVHRNEGEDWKLQAIGEGISATHPSDAAKQVGRFLSD